MKIIKKCLVFMLMIFAFTSCSLLFPASDPITTVNTPSSFSSSQKRVAIMNGPDYIRRKVADRLSNRGWKVSGTNTGKETFAIKFDRLDTTTETSTSSESVYYNDYTYAGERTVHKSEDVTYGYVSVYDLRTGKRLYVYDFSNGTYDSIVNGIMAAMIRLEENMR